jgi:S-DNA-T family DNA segregation ATPase FtsK/SpoIIIE
LTRLVQRGREAGLHLVAATQRPSAAILSSVMRANFPLRLVGRVVSAEDARAASGRGGTNAHLLNGRGDFLAVSGGERTLRFQAAQIRAEELERALRRQSAPGRMLALPAAVGR